ncbi:unnamed protein product [Psylliodes chrysocephalus]|uniref:Uncharacterized protein n=1 Tax=Psylliodes chrysocephalus TaxID=3402493 RepID=A0A9P0GJF9_9CUCU|nr:unnamed protein product [Psylliodes chrysocephala]
MLQTTGLDAAAYIFLGFVHNIYLPNIIISQGNRTCNDKKEEFMVAINGCFINETGRSEFNMHGYPNPYKSVLKKCSVMPQLNECFNSRISIYQDCLNSTHRNGIEVWKNIDKEVTAYVCNDNAQIAKDLFDKSDRSCYNKGISDLVNKCFLNYNNPLPLYDIEGISKQCSQLEDVESCFENNEPLNCYQNVSTKVSKKIIGILKSYICKNN